MKSKNFLKLLIAVTIAACTVYSCEKDEGFLQVSELEHHIHNKINDHRSANQLGALVFQPILFKEARKHSMKMKNKAEVTDEGLDVVFDDLAKKLGSTKAACILDVNRYAIADSIVKEIFSNKETNDISLDTFTQAGVGVVADENNNNYITILFLTIPD